MPSPVAFHARLNSTTKTFTGFSAIIKGDSHLFRVNDAGNQCLYGDWSLLDLILVNTPSRSKMRLSRFWWQWSSLPRNEWQDLSICYIQISGRSLSYYPSLSASWRMLSAPSTAITRAKSKLILLGEFTGLEHEHRNRRKPIRLNKRFSDLLRHKSNQLFWNKFTSFSEQLILTEEKLTDLAMIGITDDLKEILENSDRKLQSGGILLIKTYCCCAFCD